MTQRCLNILMICHRNRLDAYARPHALAAQLVRRGHRVTLLLHSVNDRFGIRTFDWDGVRAVEIPDLLWGRMRTGWDPWNTLNRIYFLSRERERYDLVHCFETRPATIYPALYFVRKHNLPWVTDWNDWFGRGGLIEINRPGWYRTLFGGLETYYEEAFRPKADGLTVISTALADRASGLGLLPEQVCHIPGGTFPDWFKARSKQECRLRMGFPMGAKILGFSSSTSHFDLEIVLKALKRVASEYSDVMLVITGKARKAVREMVREFEVEALVHFTGYVSLEALPWYLGCADLFLLPMADRPYNWGRWPNKMCEYLSLGRPTVANPVGDIKQLFESEQVGLLAGWDADDFAAKILHLLDNPTLAARLGEQARQVAVNLYDWHKLGADLEAFYFRVLESREEGPQVGGALPEDGVGNLTGSHPHTTGSNFRQWLIAILKHYFLRAHLVS